ncbi:hypothetical protein IJ843_05480 [bacterium]|nr:hypothetical protein [bacterium]
MQISITDKRKTENSENVQLQKGDNEILTNTNAPFSEFLQNKTVENKNDVTGIDNFQEIDLLFNSVSMDINDAMFFLNLAQEGQFSIQTSPNGDFQNLIKTEAAQNVFTQKNVEVTNRITALIEKAQKTQKPVRISFDNNISVILKIDKQGRVSAEFIPGSLEAESYLMNNISSLRQKFDEQNLAYTNLSYRQQNGRQNKSKDKNKGEA